MKTRTEELADITVRGMAVGQSLKVGDFFGGVKYYAEKEGIQEGNAAFSAFLEGFNCGLGNVLVNSACVIVSK